ncbi:MAG: GSCFA domain-containing protein [Pirellula sp.]|nr:GSCFA domain-containing protein [Pirellula sp.]
MPTAPDACACPYEKAAPAQKWTDAVAGVPDDRLNPHLPARFQLDPALKIASAGSCFAQRISESLTAQGFNYFVTEPCPGWLAADRAKEYGYGVFSARYGNVYTPLQLVQLVQRALGIFQPEEPAWSGKNDRWFDPFRPRIQPKGFSSAAELNADRDCHLQAVRQLLEGLDVFVFTLGMTEAWRSRSDGAVFPVCPGCVAGEYSAEAYEFCNFSAAEISEHLNQFFELLAGINPSARVILTVSPVPLMATMTERHVLQATTYSKAVLRVAAEEAVRRHAHVDYFASYEIITATRNTHRYFAADKRSVTADGVSHVMDAFFRQYVGQGSSTEQSPSTTRSTEATPADDLVCDELAMFEAIGNRRKEAA